MLKKVAFVLALMVCVSVALALESGPSNTVGFVKKSCTASTYTYFGLPFTFWNVVSGVPQYGTVSQKPSSVIGAQLTGGTGSTGDRAISMNTGYYAYRTTTAALWAGTLEDSSGMKPGHAFRIWNRHASAQDMVLAGQVDTSTFGPIWIAPNGYTPLSFRDARVKAIPTLNLRTSGFTGGTGASSDRLIELGTGSYAYYNTGTSLWVYNPTSFTSVSPGMAYRIWNRHATGWNYNYGPGAVSRPPDRPGDDNPMDKISRPNRPTGNAR
jgi:hypothetical protein